MLLEEDLVNNEVKRIELLFEKNNYNNDQKKWFLESKLKYAKATNDVIVYRVCNILINNISKED